jgi:hypothetical protein
MKFKELLDGILNEYTEDDYNICIKKFRTSKNIIEECLRKNTKLNHDNKNLIIAIKTTSFTLIKEYKKDVQNNILIKEKYNELIKTMFEYNKVLNIYKENHPEDNIETFGDIFRKLGFKTNKNSVKTE